MNKLTAYIERYLQWVTLALALLWVAYIGYGFWLNNPVTVPFSGKLLAPGDVDKAVADDPAYKKLQKEINDRRVPSEITMAEDFAGEFERKIMLGNLAGLGTGKPFFQGSAATMPTTQEVPTDHGPGIAIIPIFNPHDPTDHPDTFVILGSVAGLSQVNKTQLGAAAGVPPAPGAAPVGGPNADIAWITVSGKFIAAVCATAMQKAQIPPLATLTQFLRVELVREELIDGAWVNLQMINPINAANMQPFPPGDTRAAQLNYLDWANKNGLDITNPMFYAWLAGDKWRTITQPPPPLVMPVAKVFDPANPGPGPFTPEQQKQIDDYKKSHQPIKPIPHPLVPPSHPPTHIVPHSGGSGSTGLALSAIITNDSDLSLAQATPPSWSPFANPQPGSGMPIVPSTPLAPGTPPPPAPANKFNPSNVQDAEIWAHDTSVQPGHVYRYKMRLFLLNPLYDTQALAKNPVDTVILAAPVAETDWSEAIQVPERVHFFVKEVGGGGILALNSMATVDIFFWANGQWNRSTAKCSAGDEIVYTGTSPFTTGCFLVDFRGDGALFANSANKLRLRKPKDDKESPLYKYLAAVAK